MPAINSFFESISLCNSISGKKYPVRRYGPRGDTPLVRKACTRFERRIIESKRHARTLGEAHSDI